jgi:hypothetical protein
VGTGLESLAVRARRLLLMKKIGLYIKEGGRRIRGPHAYDPSYSLGLNNLDRDSE